MDQLNLFEWNTPKYKITKPIRLIELFAGIGSQAKALRNLGANFEAYRVIEFDKYAIASYNAVHGTNFPTMDITQTKAIDLGINDNAFTYLLTYSFPCQDLSLAGKQRGMTKGNNTRSGLLWEVERLLDESQALCKLGLGYLPDVLLMENVPQVIGKKNIDDFKKWITKLESLGYSNFVKVINAKDHEIPQNRQRCFMVSILGDYYYEFPKNKPLKKKLKDLLETNVDEKYFLSDAKIESISNWKAQQKPLENMIDDNKKVCQTLTARGAGEEHSGMVLVKEKTGGVAIRNATKKGYLIANYGDGIDISSRMETHRGTVQKDMSQTLKTQIDIGVLVKNE